MSSESRCSLITGLRSIDDYPARRTSFRAWVSRVAFATSSGIATTTGPAKSHSLQGLACLDRQPSAS